jgi:hypothetical protein
VYQGAGDVGDKKKTDEVTPDDVVEDSEEQGDGDKKPLISKKAASKVNKADLEGAGDTGDKEEEPEEEDAEVVEDEEASNAEEEEGESSQGDEPGEEDAKKLVTDKASPRRRRARKE